MLSQSAICCIPAPRGSLMSLNKTHFTGEVAISERSEARAETIIADVRISEMGHKRPICDVPRDVHF